MRVQLMICCSVIMMCCATAIASHNRTIAAAASADQTKIIAPRKADIRNIRNSAATNRSAIVQYEIPIIEKEDPQTVKNNSISRFLQLPVPKTENIQQKPDKLKLFEHEKHQSKPRGISNNINNAITTTPRTTNFVQNFANNFLLSNFWGFSQQPQHNDNAVARVAPSTTTSTTPTTLSKHPPKKYLSTPAGAVVAGTTMNNSHAPKPVKYNKFTKPTGRAVAPIKRIPATKITSKTAATITTTTTTTTTRKPQTEGPFRIALPTINFSGIAKQSDKDKRNSPASNNDIIDATSVISLRERYNCPQESEVRFQLFPKICKVDKDCSAWGRDQLCCEIFGAKSCVDGMHKPLEEAPHAPILGLIPRKCPTRPLAELWWDVQECNTDMDCWPRVCCPDGRRRYCRTSQPELETAPVPVKRSFDYLTEYLECTPAPPPIFDLHPKKCSSTFDCFPNVCCQEAGKRHCRPPKKSVLTLMANFLNVDFVKRIAQNIVIK